MKKLILVMALSIFSPYAVAQTADDYGDNHQTASLLDPSRLTVQNSVSFGAAGSGSSSLKSQSLYSTMMQYQFSSPVTMNLNFSLPLHSTFSPSQNMTSENMQSLEYFKSMPWDVSLTWRPLQSMQMKLSVVHQTESQFQRQFLNSGYDLFGERIRD